MKIPGKVIALLLSILMAATLVSFTAFNRQAQASYAMYVNDKQVGIVKFAAKGLAYYDAVMEELKSKYPDNVEIKSNVYFKEVDSSTAPTGESLIISAIEEAIDIQTTAYAIVVNGQIIGYVSSQAEADSIMNAVKKPYIDEILSRNGSQLNEVKFAEEIRFDQVTINYNQLMTADEVLGVLQQNLNGTTEYVAEQGDTFWSIAVSNGIKVNDVIAMNPDIDPQRVKPGDVIVISKEKKLLNVITKETLEYDDEIPFSEEIKEDNTLLKGRTKVIQEGKKGVKQVQVQIVRENGVEVSREVISETVKEAPVNKIIVVGTKKQQTTQPSRGSSPSPTSKPKNNTPNTGSDKNETPKPSTPSTPSNGKVTGADIVAYAKKFLGKPYVYGANGPNAFDCSGFTCYVYRHFGYSLNRSAKDQAKNGTPVSKSELQPGDILLFKDAYHVGIYIGDGKFIHASSGTNMKVVITSLDSGRYPSRYYGARRILK